MNAKSALALVALFASCKPAASSNTAADAALVSVGQEALLSSDSVPEPIFSPKQSPEDSDPGRHQLGDPFTRAEIASVQTAGSSLTGTPAELQGIWWMDGNPIPDETVSFAGVDFSQERPLLPVFGSNNFSFHAGLDAASSDTRHGNMAFSLAKNFSLIYEFNFIGGVSKYDIAKIVPTFILKVGSIEKRLRLSERILGFTMNRTGPHLYSRDNTVRGKPIDSYQLRRILVPSAADPKVLEKTEWWDLYIRQASPTHLRLSKRI